MSFKLGARRYRISGRVQGVGFRYFVYHWATQLELKGDVRNLADGDVEVYAVGTPERLDRLKEKLERGPTMARVIRLEESAAGLDPEIDRFSIEGD